MTTGNREEAGASERELITMERMYGKLREHAEALCDVLQPIYAAADEVKTAHNEACENGAVDELFVKTMESLEEMEFTIAAFRKDFPATESSAKEEPV